MIVFISALKILRAFYFLLKMKDMNTIRKVLLKNYTPGTHNKSNPFIFEGTYEEFLKIPHHSYLNAAFEDPYSFYMKDYIKCECVDCDEEIINQVASYYSFEKRIKKGTADSSQRGFLCKSCKIKKEYQKKFGVDSPQQLQEIKDKNKNTFYKNHPQFNRFSEEAILWEGSFDDLMKQSRKWNQKFKIKCDKCGQYKEINFGTLSVRYEKLKEENRSTDKILCSECMKSEANHSGMLPLREEPYEWNGTYDELIKEDPFHHLQKIKFRCEHCGKEVIQLVQSIIMNPCKNRLVCKSCQIIETSQYLYNRDSPQQIHFSDEVWAVISDKSRFENYINNYDNVPLADIGESIGVSEALMGRRIKKFNIPYKGVSKSKEELSIENYFTSRGYEVYRNRRDIIPPQEIDIFIPSLNLGIEYNGWYWHKDKDKYYHQNKALRCREKGIRLIQFYQKEWSLEEIYTYLDKLLKGKGEETESVDLNNLLEGKVGESQYHEDGDYYGDTEDGVRSK